MTEPLVITRVTHSCHLIQIGGLTVLTDPWFSQRAHVVDDVRGEDLPEPVQVASVEQVTVQRQGLADRLAVFRVQFVRHCVLRLFWYLVP